MAKNMATRKYGKSMATESKIWQKPYKYGNWATQGTCRQNLQQSLEAQTKQLRIAF